MKGGNPVFPGEKFLSKSDARQPIIDKYQIDIDTSWLIDDSFSTGLFILTTTKPDNMWSI